MTNVVYRLKGTDYIRQMIATSRSLKNLGHDVATYVYTDQEYSELSAVPCGPCIRPEYFSRPFMVADLACIVDWATFAMMEHTHPEPTLFLDSDTVVLGNVDEVLEDDWDICVTYREGDAMLYQLMPYNFGVWWMRPSMPTLWAMHWLFERCLKLTPDYQNWYGEQIALRELIGPVVKQGITAIMLPCGVSLRVKMVPCDVYNFTPEEGQEFDISTKKILHLKGPRKDQIPYYLSRAMG